MGDPYRAASGTARARSPTASREVLEMLVDPHRQAPTAAAPLAEVAQGRSTVEVVRPDARRRSSRTRSTACSCRTSSRRASTSRARPRARCCSFTGDRPRPRRRIREGGCVSWWDRSPITVWQEIWLGSRCSRTLPGSRRGATISSRSVTRGSSTPQAPSSPGIVRGGLPEDATTALADGRARAGQGAAAMARRRARAARGCLGQSSHGTLT